MFRMWAMWLTGGRPMKRGAYRFDYAVTGAPVYYFTDYWGRVWLARSAWDLMRVSPRGDE